MHTRGETAVDSLAEAGAGVDLLLPAVRQAVRCAPRDCAARIVVVVLPLAGLAAVLPAGRQVPRLGRVGARAAVVHHRRADTQPRAAGAWHTSPTCTYVYLRVHGPWNPETAAPTPAAARPHEADQGPPTESAAKRLWLAIADLLLLYTIILTCVHIYNEAVICNLYTVILTSSCYNEAVICIHNPDLCIYNEAVICIHNS